MSTDITVYFAVSKYNDFMYLHEKFTHPDKAASNQSKLIDIIDDYTSLEGELEWDKLMENQKPNQVGVYAAIVRQAQTAEDDFELNVISCTPVYTFADIPIEKLEGWTVE